MRAFLQVLDRGSKKSDALRKKLLADAEKHRNRLLDYDKAHEKRTKVNNNIIIFNATFMLN